VIKVIIKIQSLLSEIHNHQFIEQTLNYFKVELEYHAMLKGITFSENPGEDYDLEIWYIKSGGVENQFMENFDKDKKFYLLLTTDKHNSLPAALEIHAFIKQQGCDAEILHGEPEAIANRLYQITKSLAVIKELHNIRIGVIGQPSDWLIASAVDYELTKEKLGIELIDIDLEEFYDIWNEIDKNNVKTEYDTCPVVAEYDEMSVKQANAIYKVLKIIINKYNLQALTIRCFDLVSLGYGTGCLALSYLNSEDIISGCEGDIPAVISMVLLHKLTDQQVFMANPSRINVVDNTVVLAHCTLPWNMSEERVLDTHFETGQGIGVRGNIPLGPATVFRMDNLGLNYFVSAAEIINNLNESSLCRTQITAKLTERINYFLEEPLGNHHLICLGDHSQIVKQFFKFMGRQ